MELYYHSGTDLLRDVADTLDNRNRFIYDGAGHLSAVTDKARLTSTTAPPEKSYVYTYLSNGALAAVGDPDDPTDPNDGLIQSFDSGCESISTSPGVTMQKIDHFTSYYDRRGNRVDYIYDSPSAAPWPDGNLVRIETDLGQRKVASRFAYDTSRNLRSAFDEINHGWTATYDDRGNMTTRTERVSDVQTWLYQWSYDANNNVTQYTDPASNVTQFFYEDVAYPTLVTRIVEPADGQGLGSATTRMSYSGGQLTEVIGPYVVDPDVVDPNGVITRFAYDSFGQPSRYSEGELDLGGGVTQDVFYETFVYDGGSRMISSGGSVLDGCSGGGVASVAAQNTATYNTLNHLIGSSCGIKSAASATASVPNGSVPASPASLPEISAFFDGATHTPTCELTSMPLVIEIPDVGFLDHTLSFDYDNLGRTILASKGASTFTYAYDTFGGKVARNGPDGVATEVTLDVVGRVAHTRRGPAGASLVEARYEYYDNSLTERMTHYNADGVTVNGRVAYTYYDNNLVHEIDHQNGLGVTVVRYEYVYDDIGAPASITEYDLTGTAQFVTNFYYDNRGRLFLEHRSIAGTSVPVYTFFYEYDAGGNRKRKVDAVNGTEWLYTYDIEDPPAYGSANNRLMMVKEYAVAGDLNSLSKTTWYTYNCVGNVTRIISLDESVAATVGGGLSGLADGGTSKLSSVACSGNKKQYTATRFEYAKNGRTVTHAVGEQWCWDDSDVNNPTTDYTVTWGHQFLYDGARQRYLDVELDPVQLTVGNIAELSRTETDYDGNQPYRSTRTDAATGATSVTGYELGLARIDNMASAPQTSYYHTDMLGTTLYMASQSGSVEEQASYTAFGERVTGTGDRFGYVGAFGYQNTKSATGAEEMPYLHVGARYYDPASGRFLQHDPIGIRGGFNVYVYVGNNPIVRLDPSGLGPIDWLYTGSWSPAPGVYDAAVGAAGAWLLSNSPVRGGYAGLGGNIGGNTPNRGVGVGAGLGWTIDSGGFGYAGAGLSISRRGRGNDGIFASNTGTFGLGYTTGSGAALFEGIGSNRSGRGAGVLIGGGTLNLGINYGVFNCGLVIDLGKLGL